MKIYGIWDGWTHLGDVEAENPTEAIALGRRFFGESARAAILDKDAKATRREPMFAK